ncbi:MAG: hypothetical protein H6Q07_1346 [Acidobacteria bacterium]|nr:hypothetical protein [Acidobacteriota bacterium]
MSSNPLGTLGFAATNAELSEGFELVAGWTEGRLPMIEAVARARSQDKSFG